MAMTVAERRQLALAPFSSIPVEHRLTTRVYRGMAWTGSQMSHTSTSDGRHVPKPTLGDIEDGDSNLRYRRENDVD